MPIISDGKVAVAENLPTLSKHGYYLVSSDIIANKDYAKKGDPLSILDVVPISSLSNQDFIADRTWITHTLTNPKVLNNINISVFKPDMTAPSLEPNSAIILKITKPLPTPTEMIENIVNEQTSQLVGEQVQAQEKAELQAQQQQTQK